MNTDWWAFLTGSMRASRKGISRRAKHRLARRWRGAFDQARRMSAGQFRACQRRALAERLAHAVRHVPYYRQRRRDYVRNARPLELAELPILDRAAVRARAGEFFADGGVGRSRTSATSGSTGEPLAVRTSYRAHGLFQAGLERHRSGFGVRPVGRVAMLTASFWPAGQSHRQIRWRDCIGARLYLSPCHIVDGRIAQYAELLRSFRPESIFGYASASYMLAAALRRNGLRPPDSIRAVFTVGDVLHPQWRERIEEVFGAPVAEQYSSHEAQHLVTQCPAGGLHINPEHGIVEVVDDSGQPAPAGIEGDVLLTGLANDAMPLVRYRIGDRASLLADHPPCPCGLQWPRLAAVLGRDEDTVRVPDGRTIMLLNQHCTRNVAGIVQSQFVQDAPDHLRVLLVTERPFGPASERAMAAEIRRRTQYDFQIDFEYVEQIPRGRAGKFQAVVSLLAVEPAPQARQPEDGLPARRPLL